MGNIGWLSVPKDWLASFGEIAKFCGRVLGDVYSLRVLRFLGEALRPCGLPGSLVEGVPLGAMRKTSIPGSQEFNTIWGGRAPLGWDSKDLTPTAKAVVALLSDWFPSTTGEMVHVDGGLHSTGA